MKTFKPPKVIYLNYYKEKDSIGFCQLPNMKTENYKYFFIDNNWQSKFRKKHPMLCSKEAGVIGFIEKEVLGGNVTKN